jgi:hypothetical protein
MASFTRSAANAIRSSTSRLSPPSARAAALPSLPHVQRPRGASVSQQQQAGLHTSARLNKSTATNDQTITKEQTRQSNATDHDRASQIASQTPAIDFMTGEVRTQADIDVGFTSSSSDGFE